MTDEPAQPPEDEPIDPSVDVWARIVASPLQSIYLTELYWLARSIVEACDRVFSEAPAPPTPTQSYIAVNHELHRVIYGALSDAARLRWLITDRPRRGGQSALEHGVQERRTAWLRALLAGLALDEILDPKVRHSLEHFDEHLDSTGIAGVTGELGPSGAALPYDMALGRANSLRVMDWHDPDIAFVFLRVYLAEERVFVNGARRIDLGALRRDAAAIAERAGLTLPKKDLEAGRGAGIVLVVKWPPAAGG